MQGKGNHHFLSVIMADEFDEIPQQWFEDKVGQEFTLPNISSPWLTKVFQLWIDKLDAAEASRRTSDFQIGRDMPKKPVEPADPDSEVGKKQIAPTPVAFLPPVQPHSQSLSEQKGISSSSVDSSMWDEASSSNEAVNQCISDNDVQGLLIDFGRGINGEGYDQMEVGART